MDVPKEILLDAAINAVGYLAAGAGTILIYSMFTKKNKSKSAPAPEQQAPTETTIAAVAVEQPRDTGQFVPLSRLSVDAAETTVSSSQQKLENGQRDRQAIMRIAREMLKAGATVERIRTVLPISAAEIALLARAEQ